MRSKGGRVNTKRQLSSLRLARVAGARYGTRTAGKEKLGVSPGEALALEGSPSGMGRAVEAGIPVVGLAVARSPNEVREAGAEFVVGYFADRALYQRPDR